MGKFKEFLASDSELVMRPIREFLGFDSESGWVTLEDKEGNPYRVNIAEKIEAAKEKKAEKEAQKQKEKEQSEEDKKKFDKLMRKIEMFSKGADDIAQHNWKDLKNKAVAKFISKRMNKEFNQILDHVKKNNLQTVEQVRDYLDESGIQKRYKELYDQCMEIHNKVAENTSWNKKIYTYKNGDKAVFLNDEKVVLNDDEYDFLRVVATNPF